MTYNFNQRVRICTLTGENFAPEWKEKGAVVKPRRENLPMPGDDWYLVRFDAGGKMCLHGSVLMADNEARP